MKLKPTADEVRFNQIHNGADLDLGAAVTLPPGPPGWGEVSAADVRGDLRGRGAVIRAATSDLVLRYGAWGNVVACAATGRVLCNAQYALALLAMRLPVRVYRLTAEQTARVGTYLTQPYGEFSYSHLARTPWTQTYAQMMRLRGGGGRSRLYAGCVLPWLAAHPGARVLDFGCGQGDYVARLRDAGVAVTGLEFFARRGSAVDIGRSRQTAAEVLRQLTVDGRWDAVVCDSVLNSTDRPEAEPAILDTLRALCRPAGTVFVSGRHVREVATQMGKTRFSEARMRLLFLDAHGYSATHVRGGWLYQRFHTDAQLQEIAARFGDPARRFDRANDECWRLQTLNLAPLPDTHAEAALRYEFDLPLPNGRTYGLADAAVAAWRNRKRAAP